MGVGSGALLLRHTTLRVGPFASALFFEEIFNAELLLGTANMENANIFAIDPIVDPTWANPYLPIVWMRKLRNTSPYHSKALQVIRNFKNLADDRSCRVWLVERNVLGNCIKLTQRRL